MILNSTVDNVHRSRSSDESWVYAWHCHSLAPVKVPHVGLLRTAMLMSIVISVLFLAYELVYLCLPIVREKRGRLYCENQGRGRT